MKILGKIISSFIHRAALCFSLIVLSFTIVGTVAGVESIGKGLAMTQLLTFFYFSALIAVSFGICDFVKNNIIVRRTLQFLLSFGSMALAFFTGDFFKTYLSGMQNPAFSVIAISFMFVIIYTVIAVAVLVFNYVVNKVTNSKKEYVSIFSEEDNQ